MTASPVQVAEAKSDHANEIDRFINEALASTDLNPLPPSVPAMMEASESLARTTLDNYQTLFAECETYRSVFKFCWKVNTTTSSAEFDFFLWQSYVTRLRLIKRSLESGMCVALQVMLQQVWMWMQVGISNAPPSGQTFLAETAGYRVRVGRVSSGIQMIKAQLAAMTFPDHEVLRQDPQLMQEIAALLRKSGDVSGNEIFLDDQQNFAQVASGHSNKFGQHEQQTELEDAVSHETNLAEFADMIKWDNEDEL